MAAEKLYFAANGVSPTTSSQVAVTTGNALKTMLQIGTPSTTSINIIEWGISFDGSAAATPIKVELMQSDVTTTGGTSVTPTIWGDPNAPASLCVGGASATCHTATGEGTTTAARMFDVQFIAPTAQYVKQFPLGREPQIPVSKFLRVRLLAGTAVNAYCYIIWSE